MKKSSRFLRKKTVAGIALGLTGFLFAPPTVWAGETRTYTGTEALQTIAGMANSFGPLTDVSGNKITINYSSGTALDFVFGACNSLGDATANRVIISDSIVNIDVYGGRARGNTFDNIVIVGGGTVGNCIYGGRSDSADANGNIVSISGSTTNVGGVQGGNAYGSANSNTVTISNAQVTQDIIGGRANLGSANDNSVTINNSQVSNNVSGGYASSGIATGNIVTINGGTAGTVFGGRSDTSSATGNSVSISGGIIRRAVYGGYTGNGSGNATGNTITISGNPSLLGILSGGYKDPGSGDAWTGNTLNVKNSGMSAAGVANFQYYNFYLPDTISSGATMLAVSNTANITGSTVNIYLAGDTMLKAGDTVTLLSRSSGTTANTTAHSYLGVATVYDFTLASGGSLSSTVSDVSQNSQVKALSEGQASSAAFLNQGMDMLSGQGLQAARSAAAGSTGQISSFTSIGGSSLRYETGSHVDVNGFSLVAGAAKESTSGQSTLTSGLFLEHGWGKYSTYNSFNNATSVNGNGDTQYFGAGWLGRKQTSSGQYLEGSVRIGQVNNNFSSSDIGAAGTTSSYDVSSPYYGLHVGFGKETAVGKDTKRDVYAKLLYTHQEGSSATVQGDLFQFDAVDSVRGQTGIKWLRKVNESTTLRTGLAYQYEFDGKASATVNGVSVDSPSLQGGTAILELGLTKEDQNSKGPTLDIGIQGLCGKTRGIAGTVHASWNF